MVEERTEAIRALEATQRRRRLGVRWPAASVAIVLGVCGLFWVYPDVAYFFSPREPITLGTEGDYHFERLTSNRYAQIHGTPTQVAAYTREGDVTMVHLGLRDTPVLVRRAALEGEDWVPGRPPMAPDQRPFGVRGRLLARKDAARFESGFKLLEHVDGVVPRDGKLWLLIEGERPSTFTGDLLIAIVLVLFVAANVFFLIRDIRARIAARAAR
ncbi:MAG: hypothetical protein IRZ16_03795 [Myxococcaceae bacterium]|nr:hypothetical protein [Myxococcaceae bacterium]